MRGMMLSSSNPTHANYASGAAKSKDFGGDRDSEHVLIMGLPVPPPPPALMADAQSCAFMDLPDECVLVRNRGLRHVRVVQPAHAGGVHDIERHEAPAALDSGARLVVQHEIARDA